MTNRSERPKTNNHHHLWRVHSQCSALFHNALERRAETVIHGTRAHVTNGDCGVPTPQSPPSTPFWGRPTGTGRYAAVRCPLPVQSRLPAVGGIPADTGRSYMTTHCPVVHCPVQSAGRGRCAAVRRRAVGPRQTLTIVRRGSAVRSSADRRLSALRNGCLQCLAVSDSRDRPGDRGVIPAVPAAEPSRGRPTGTPAGRRCVMGIGSQARNVPQSHDLVGPLGRRPVGGLAG